MQPSPAFGLCARCRHQRLVPTSRGSLFSMCERHRTDPSYPRYPPMPVTRCPGFVALPADERPAS